MTNRQQIAEEARIIQERVAKSREGATQSDVAALAALVARLAIADGEQVPTVNIDQKPPRNNDGRS